MSDYYDVETGEEVSHDDMTERFADMLDECYEPVRIGELEYLPSRVLREVDPIAFRCGVNEHVDLELGETIVEVGYWLTMTVDGEPYRNTEAMWNHDRGDALACFADMVEHMRDTGEQFAVTVRLADTNGDVIAEEAITAA